LCTEILKRKKIASFKVVSKREVLNGAVQTKSGHNPQKNLQPKVLQMNRKKKGGVEFIHFSFCPN
jgi:hypothetical protein